MTEQEFIEKVLHKPWINRADSFDAMDCYGLVKLYKEHVQGLEMPEVGGYKLGDDFNQLWIEQTTSNWQELTGWKKGAMITCYNTKGMPEHVGVCAGKMQVLHSRGCVNKPGRVELHKLAAIESAYSKVTYHELIKCQN